MPVSPRWRARLSRRALACIVFVGLSAAPLQAQTAGDGPPLPLGVLTAASGTGAFPAIAESLAGMRENTLYHPAQWPRRALPLVLWAEGGCADNGLMYATFLREIASHGYVIVAAGVPRGERLIESAAPAGAAATPAIGAVPSAAAPAARPAPAAALEADATSSAQLLQAIDWLRARNADHDSPLHGRVDLGRIAVMGHSCGGLQAIRIAADPRIRTAVVFNSGLLVQPRGGHSEAMEQTKERLLALHTPVAYINGGAPDVAYPNAADDFARLQHVPVFFAENGVGHGGTYWSAPNGGDYAQVAVAWLDWQLRGDTQAARQFRGVACGLCTRAGWKVQKKRID
jgi:hypothetical protein